MPSCVIRRNKEGRVSSVSTPSGSRSRLFDAIASIAVMPNREMAAKILKKVYSNKFASSVMDWMSNKPRNKEAYKKVLDGIGKVPPEYHEAVLQKARKMDNPILAGKVNPPGDIYGNGLSYYSEGADNPVLFDAVSMRTYDIEGDPVPIGYTSEEYEAEIVSTNTGYVLRVDRGGNSYYAVREQVPVYEPSSLSYEEPNAGITYETGEPKLFFMNGDGTYYESYGDALRASNGPFVEAGFVSIEGSKYLDPQSIKIGSEKYFTPVSRFSTSTDTSNREGLINYLIKKGYLSGSKRFDNSTGTYHLTGDGSQGAMRLFNSALAIEELRNRIPGDVSMDENGNITISQADKSKVELLSSDGTSKRVDKKSILEEVKSGGYNRLSNEYHYFDETFLALALEDNPMEGTAPLAADMQKEEDAQKNSIIEILKSLGVSVIGMSEYIEKYQTKHGVEPSARALADMANGVVALAEGATVEDLEEEAAHFLVEAYKNQDEIAAILPEVESTSAWAEHSKHYYEVYGKVYSGEQLDESVRREVLGKLLRDRLIAASNTGRRDNRTLLGRIGTLASNIIDSLRSMFSSQRSELNQVIDRISELALSDKPDGFDVSLLKESPWVLYSSYENQRAKFLRDRVSSLRKSANKIRQIERGRGITSESSLRAISEMEKRLQTVSDNITDVQVISTVEGIVNSASAAVRYLTNMMDKNDSSGSQLSPSDRMNMRIINEEILPNLVSLRGFVDSGMHIEHPEKLKSFVSGEEAEADLNAIKNDYSRRIDGVISDIHRLSPRIEATLSRDTDSLVDRLMERFNVPLEHREGIKRAVSGVQTAGNFMARWFGILEHSSNPINGMLGALIAENNVRALRETEMDLSSFLKKVQSEGWSTKEFENLLQKHGGKMSNFLMGPLNMAKFEHDYKVAQVKALAMVQREFAEIVGYDEQNGTFNESKVEEIVNLGNPFGFKIKEIGDDGQIHERHVAFRPSLDRINLDLLTSEEEIRFNEIMNEWAADNMEQPYKEGYESFYDKIYKSLESKGTVISQRTKDFIHSQSRSRFMIRKPFYGEDGKFNYSEYYLSGAAEEILALRKERRAAASNYMYIGGQRVMKPEGSEELQLARELQAIDAEIRSTESSSTSPSDASAGFLQAIREAQAAGGSEDAWRVLSYGGHLSFSEKFWDAIGFGEAARTESNNKLSYERLADEIVDRSIDTLTAREETEKIVDRIKKNQADLREIISNNRDTSNPGEVAFDSMSLSEIETIESLSEEIEADYRALMLMAKAAEIDVDEFLERSSEAENMPNKAYWDAFKDSGMKEEWRFASKHMTRSKRARLMAFASKINNIPGNKKTFSAPERNYLAEALGITSWKDSTDFKKKANGRLEEIGAEERAKILNGYARGLVLPYFKRMAPAGYDSFMKSVRDGKADIPGFFSDLQSGLSGKASIEKYGFDLSYLSYSPNRESMAEESLEESDHNPNYDPDLGFGWKIPRMDKYMDDSYYDYFGIKKGDINGKATRNVREFEMIEMMKEINRKSFDKYGEKGRCIYSIPQISKQGIERIADAGSGIAAAGASLQNYMRDLVSERVDDPMYGPSDHPAYENDTDRIKAIPKYYINQLENQNDVSHDLGYSFSMLMSQANLYDQKQKTMTDALGLQQIMLNSQFENGKRPEATQAYAMFKDFLESHYYGIQVNNKRITWNLGGFTIDATKLMQLFNRFVSMMNLALSPFVAATGAVTGQANFLIEGAVGQYIDMDSVRYAYRELSRLAPGYLGEIGNVDRNNKLYVIGENLGVFQMRNRIFGAGYGRLARIFMRDSMYKMMEFANAPLDPQVMIAVLDSVRYYKGPGMEKGRFFTRKELMDYLKSRDEDVSNFRQFWKTLREKSLWNCIETEGNEVVAKKGMDVDADVIAEFYGRRNKVRSLMQICNGSLNEENRIGATRNSIGMLTTAHRGWMFLSAQRLWKRRGYNFQTLQYEEGLSQTIFSLFKSMVGLTKQRTLEDISAYWNSAKGELDDVQKQNLKRSIVYLYVGAIMFMLSLLFRWYRDDDDNDDNWTAQFLSYIGMRTINEIASQMPFIFEANLVDAAEDPFVIARKTGELLNTSSWSLDKVTSGTYEGESKLWRTICKMTFLKQWYNVKTPEAIRKSSDWWLQNNSKSMMFFFWGRGKDEKAEFEPQLYPSIR